MNETKEWKQFGSPVNKLTFPDKISKSIIIAIGEKLSYFFSYTLNKGKRPHRTRCIKDTLAILGQKKDYKVYANGLSPKLCQINGGTFKNAEWQYDLHWYTEGKQPYTTIRLPLVMECEWQQKRKGDQEVEFSGIKYDFQKLLISNAELRLMIFKVVKDQDLKTLSDYFEFNIYNYKHLLPGSKFLFIAFSERLKTFFYKEIKKR